VTGVKLADDAAFSQLPFVQADDVFLKVEHIPLLRKEIKVTELVLRQPQIRIIRGASGAMNVSTIAKKGPTGAGNPTEAGATPEFGIAASSNKSGGASTISNVTIETFTIEDGRIFYLDQQAGGAPVTINAVNLKVANFSVAEPFDVALDLAAFGDRKNLELLGTAGPIAKDGAIEAGAIPINLVATVGPLTLAELKSVPQLAKAIPRALMLSDEVKLQAKVTGTLDAISFDASSDLSANRVAFAPSFDKPAGTTFKFTASGARTAGKVVVQQADLGLADLQAKLTDIVFATGRVSARVDTNKFDLGPIADLISAAQPYNPTGAAEIHTAISLVNSKPALNGTITLVNVNAAMPDAKTPPVSDLNGTIRLAGNTANLGPLTFKLGSGNAQLQASADSIRPAHATYRLSVDKITVAAFDGSIGAAGVAKIGTASAFDFKIDTQHVNMQKALDSQHSPAANTIRGNLTGNIQIAGRGKGLDQIKPTMRGAGRARMDKGKLVGVNVVAQALKKVDNVPGIGALVPAAVVANHPELFQSPDTDIQQASLTFEILGPRIISHDIVARSTDYSIFGDGWFDLDKNLDLAAKIKMSRTFSSELVAAKHNISYVTNSDGEVEIPLRVSGQLPHPSVVPDVGVIAQRAATHAVQNRVGELIQKKGLGDVLKKNGLGGLLGGLTGGGADSNGGANDASPSSAGGSNDRGSLPNPFKGLFH
jgi:uncharacterized protein involved in outer membrane biogenesis